MSIASNPTGAPWPLEFCARIGAFLYYGLTDTDLFLELSTLSVCSEASSREGLRRFHYTISDLAYSHYTVRYIEQGATQWKKNWGKMDFDNVDYGVGFVDAIRLARDRRN